MDLHEHPNVHEEGHDQEHHEKKSVLKKVKDKAKKIKDTITKKHEHGEDLHHEEEEEHHTPSEEEEEEDAEIHGAPMYESEAAKGFVESHEKPPQEKGVKLAAAAANLEKDPRAPTPTTEAPPFPGSYQPGLSSAGGPEPGLIRSFQAMSTEEKTSPPEAETAPMGETEQHQTQSEQGYKEKITSTVVDKAFHAKEAAVMAAAGTAEYGKKIAESVYEKVTPQKKEEEKAELAAQGSKPTDKWVSMKEYLSEKLSPGEEDRALCDVISESMQKRKEEEGDIREETEAKEAASGEKKSRKGVVGKIKGAVVSVFGGQHSSPVKARGEEVQSMGVEKERAPRLQESAN